MATTKTKEMKLVDWTRPIQEASSSNPAPVQASATSTRRPTSEFGAAYSDRLQSLPMEILLEIACYYLRDQPMLEHHYFTNPEHHLKVKGAGGKIRFPKFNGASNIEDIEEKVEDLKATRKLASHEHALFDVSQRLREAYLDQARKFIRPVFHITKPEALFTDALENLARSVCPSHTPIPDATSFSIMIDFVDPDDFFPIDEGWKIPALSQFIGTFTHATEARITWTWFRATSYLFLYVIRNILKEDSNSCLKRFRCGEEGGQKTREYIRFPDGRFDTRAEPKTMSKVEEIKQLMRRQREAREMESTRKARKAFVGRITQT